MLLQYRLGAVVRETERSLRSRQIKATLQWGDEDGEPLHIAAYSCQDKMPTSRHFLNSRSMFLRRLPVQFQLRSLVVSCAAAFGRLRSFLVAWISGDLQQHSSTAARTASAWTASALPGPRWQPSCSPASPKSGPVSASCLVGVCCAALAPGPNAHERGQYVVNF